MLVRAYLYLKLFVSLVKIMNLANLAKFLIFMICICYDYFNVVENKHNLLMNGSFQAMCCLIYWLIIILQALVRWTSQSYILEFSLLVLNPLIYPTNSRSLDKRLLNDAHLYIVYPVFSCHKVCKNGKHLLRQSFFAIFKWSLLRTKKKPLLIMKIHLLLVM